MLKSDLEFSFLKSAPNRLWIHSFVADQLVYYHKERVAIYIITWFILMNLLIEIQSPVSLCIVYRGVHCTGVTLRVAWTSVRGYTVEKGTWCREKEKYREEKINRNVITFIRTQKSAVLSKSKTLRSRYSNS